jgi:hypothetical protein
MTAKFGATRRPTDLAEQRPRDAGKARARSRRRQSGILEQSAVAATLDQVPTIVSEAARRFPVL